MKSVRPALFILSTAIAAFLIAGGLAVKVGAGENSYRQVVLFSEVLSLVVDNYVDPVDAERLLGGAYEGLLGGLDANGAYLSPEEVAEWKSRNAGPLAQPGFRALKAGRALQVVHVDPGSPAEQAGIEVGDQIREVEGRPVRDLSLAQAWQLVLGPDGTTVKLDLLHPADGFRREQVEVTRRNAYSRPYDLEVKERIAVLRIHDMERASAGNLADELDDVRSRGVTALLLDLRNLADLRPSAMAATGALFAPGVLLNLRDRAGELVDSVESGRSEPVWSGEIAVLVNGATAGSSEALASVIQAELEGPILGEPTYGLGAEAKLFELDNGAGLVVSSALWETASGRRWNGDGVVPDEEIRGSGQDYEAVSADQLERALEWFESSLEVREARKIAA